MKLLNALSLLYVSGHLWPRRLIWLLLAALLFPVMTLGADRPDPKIPGPRRSAIDTICMHPVGVVQKAGAQARVEIYPQFEPALLGLSGFSHVWVFYWFHENDREDERRTLKVHPRRDPANPLTGVFATRAPVRPNLIGMTACRIIGIKGNLLELADLDAREGSPVIDLKPYIPGGDAIPDATVPDWVHRLKRGD